jgi:hypothetical protein
MQTNHLFTFQISIRAAVILIVVIMSTFSCNMPKPTSGDQNPTDARTLATSQQSIQGEDEGKADMDCQKNGPWYLTVDHSFIQTIGDATFTIKIQGSATLTVDKTGNVTSGGATGIFTMESHAKDCNFMGLEKYNAKITGTCNSGTMDLRIEELFGAGGAVTGTLKCGDQEPITSYFGFPAMQHDLRIPLDSSKGGGSKTISWGTGEEGYKRWFISNTDSLQAEPLVNP